MTPTWIISQTGLRTLIKQRSTSGVGKNLTAAVAGGCNMRMRQTAALALQQSLVKHD